MDMKLEVVVLPVSDVDRAKQFYEAAGFRLDAAPDHGSYGSWASFSDPDGNGWMIQEVTTRLPGRMSARTTFASADELMSALSRAAAAHGEHEARTGEEDADWPTWYAEYMMREQAGEELPV
jgi:catechol 2,3-dioxygenase-like lactoylglutathione lyase family enzyme